MVILGYVGIVSVVIMREGRYRVSGNIGVCRYRVSGNIEGR